MEEEEPVVEEGNEPEPEPELGLETADGSPEEYGIFSGSKGESDGKFHGEEELTEIPQYDSKEKGNNSNEGSKETSQEKDADSRFSPQYDSKEKDNNSNEESQETSQEKAADSRLHDSEDIFFPQEREAISNEESIENTESQETRSEDSGIGDDEDIKTDEKINLTIGKYDEEESKDEKINLTIGKYDEESKDEDRVSSEEKSTNENLNEDGENNKGLSIYYVSTFWGL